MIKELWNGQYASCCDNTIDTIEEKNAVDALDKYHTELTARLEEIERKIFEDFAEAHQQLLAIECEKAFVKGFSLATQILSEAFMK